MTRVQMTSRLILFAQRKLCFRGGHITLILKKRWIFINSKEIIYFSQILHCFRLSKANICRKCIFGVLHKIEFLVIWRCRIIFKNVMVIKDMIFI